MRPAVRSNIPPANIARYRGISLSRNTSSERVYCDLVRALRGAPTSTADFMIEVRLRVKLLIALVGPATGNVVVRQRFRGTSFQLEPTC
jgi:hypothetical protein